MAHDRAWQLEWLRRRATGTTAEVLGASALPVGPAGPPHAARRHRPPGLRRARRREPGVRDGVRRGGERGARHRQPRRLAGADLPRHRAPAVARLDAAGHLPRPADPLRRARRRALAGACAGGARRRRGAAEPRGTGRQRQQRVGGRRSPHGQRVPADRWRPAPHPRVAGGLPPGAAGRRGHPTGSTTSTSSASRSPACPACSTSPTPARWPGRSPTRWPTTRTSSRSPGPARSSSARTETMPVRGRPDEPVEVTVTEHGPVYTDGYAFRGPSTVLGDLGFAALLPLLRARSADDVDRALDLWVEPVNNAVIADREGRVRYRLAGRVPVRSDDAWTGWLGPHRAEVDADGEVVTANERRGPESDAVGSGFAPPVPRRPHPAPARGSRRPAPRRLRRDPRRHPARHRRPAAHARAGGARRLGRTDGRRLHHRGPVGARGGTPSAGGSPPSPSSRRCTSRAADPVHAAWLDVTSRIGLALPTLVAAGTPFGIDVAALARAALHDVRLEPATTWGETHVLSTTHAFDLLARRGRRRARASRAPAARPRRRRDCVRCTGGSPGLAVDRLPRLGRTLRLGPRRPAARRMGRAAGRLGRAGAAPPRPAGRLGRRRARCPWSPTGTSCARPRWWTEPVRGNGPAQPEEVVSWRPES